MGRTTWALIKADKNFNVQMYRRGLSFLLVSLVLNVILGVLIVNVFLQKPERDFYATDGITPPVQLTPLLTRNMSPQPLLAPDPIAETEGKVIPQ